MATRRTEFNFNARNPSASRAAHRYAAKRITEISTETRAAIRALVIRGLRENIPPRKLARMLAGKTEGVPRLIGMHSRQAMAALNYQSQLEAMGLATSTVNRLMGKYVRRKIDERALNIARTETMTALNFGRNAAHNTALRKGLIPKGAGKEWLITPDERLCKLCEPMSGVVVGVRQKFQTARGPVAAPPLHPSCRCTTGLKPIRGGKRIGLDPRPTAPPVLPLPKPKAPPLPATAPKPAPAPTTPPTSSSTEGLPPPAVQFSNNASGNAKGRMLGFTEQMENETQRFGEQFQRTRGVKVPVLLRDGNIPSEGEGVLGIHYWTKAPIRRSRIEVVAKQSLAMRADELAHGLGTGQNAIVNNSVMGTYRHEFGHAVYYQGLSPTEARRWRNLFSSMRNTPPPTPDPFGNMTGISAISQYAEYNASEMFAEAWTVYSDPKYVAGMLPKRIEDFFEATLKTAAPADSVAAGGAGWK
jgi:hypothetical protein